MYFADAIQSQSVKNLLFPLMTRYISYIAFPAYIVVLELQYDVFSLFLFTLSAAFLLGLTDDPVIQYVSIVCSENKYFSFKWSEYKSLFFSFFSKVYIQNHFGFRFNRYFRFSGISFLNYILFKARHAVPHTCTPGQNIFCCREPLICSHRI